MSDRYKYQIPKRSGVLCSGISGYLSSGMLENFAPELMAYFAAESWGTMERNIHDTNVHLADCRKRRNLPSKILRIKGSLASICFEDRVGFFAFSTSNPKPSLA